MRLIISIIAFFISFWPAYAQDYDEFIADLIDQTNIDTLTSLVRILTGEDSVSLGSRKILIKHRMHPNNDLAADYIKYKLETYGLDTYDQIYSGSGRNVYAIQPGSTYEDQQFIICAHYDAVDYYCADDNASSVATILEAARILSHHQFDYTIIYALWDEEEIVKTGSYETGSKYYASRAYANNSDIRGVLNLEMLGWDQDDDGKNDIHTSDIANSVSLANLVFQIASLYNLSLNPIIYNPGTRASDHRQFWDNGFSAVEICQAFFGGDYNPYYHTNEDRIDKFNLPYFHELAKLAIGSISTLAHENPIACVENIVRNIPMAFNLNNYPNPFNHSTIIHYEIPKDEYVVLSVFNCIGEKITELVNEYQRAGNYKIRFDADNLFTGVYFMKISTPTMMKTEKMILVR